MRKLIFFTLSALFFPLASGAFGSPYLNSNKTGAIVIDIASGRVIAEQNADMMLNPASLTKIATAYAALKRLGPAHRIETVFCSPSPLNERRINKLYVIGHGDPVLVEEDYWRIAGELKTRGVTSVGDIVICQDFFDGGFFPSQIALEDTDRAYFANTSALPLNFNSISVTALPDGRAFVTPNLGSLRLITRWSGGPTSLSCSSEGNSQICTLSGQYPKEPMTFYKRLADPSIAAGTLLESLLELKGVPVTGTIAVGHPPANCQDILTNKSKPLSTIVKMMMIYSNNFIAEQLVKYLGAIEYGPPGSTPKGMDAVRAELSSAGIKNFNLENGSGLSNDNRISARALGQLLATAARDQAIGAEFMASFAREDDSESTLRAWSFPGAIRPLRGKTGTLSTVSALAGFSKGKAFAIIANDTPKGPVMARKAIVDLLMSMMGETR